jgi:hypothetical protein
MRAGTRRAGAVVAAVFALGLGACGGSSNGTATPQPDGAATAPPPEALPAPEKAPSAAFDAVIRPKYSDDDYTKAIADLEGANGMTDASTDLAAGRKRLLGIPQSQGPSKLVGVKVTRAQLPDEVAIVRIAGVVVGTENRHALRFEMLMLKYAEAYNQAMLRGIQ